jgi:predicted dehydrogenase
MEAPVLRWGILAPGGIAHRFYREVTEYTASSIVAVGSRDKKRAEAFLDDVCAPTHSGTALDFIKAARPRTYGSYEELVADPDVDAVYVASPHSEHHDLAILALEAGKPVLVEKAFTLNARQAEEVFAVAERKNLFAMEAMWSRFLPTYHGIRAIVESGELGEIQAVTGVHAQSLNMDPAWRMMNRDLGGGALLDLGIYPLSLIHFLLGVPDSIQATGVLTSTGVDLRENITLTYGEKLGIAYNDMGLAGRGNAQILCDKGRLEVLDWFYTPNDILVTPLGGESYTLPTKVEGGFQYEAAEVARRITAGETQSEWMTWKDTIEVLRICDEVRNQLGVRYPAD